VPAGTLLTTLLAWPTSLTRVLKNRRVKPGSPPGAVTGLVIDISPWRMPSAAARTNPRARREGRSALMKPPTGTQ